MPPPAVPFNPFERLQYLLALGRTPENAYNEVQEELAGLLLAAATDDAEDVSRYFDLDGMAEYADWIVDSGFADPAASAAADARAGAGGLDDVTGDDAIDAVEQDLSRVNQLRREPPDMVVEGIREGEAAAQWNEFDAFFDESLTEEQRLSRQQSADDARRRAAETRRRFDPEGTIPNRSPRQHYTGLSADELSRQLQTQPETDAPAPSRTWSRKRGALGPRVQQYLENNPDDATRLDSLKGHERAKFLRALHQRINRGGTGKYDSPGMGRPQTAEMAEYLANNPDDKALLDATAPNSRERQTLLKRLWARINARGTEKHQERRGGKDQFGAKMRQYLDNNPEDAQRLQDLTGDARNTFMSKLRSRIKTHGTGKHQDGRRRGRGRNMAEDVGLRGRGSDAAQPRLDITIEDFQREMAQSNVRGGIDIDPIDLPKSPQGLTVAVIGGRDHQDPKLVWQALMDLDAKTPIQRVQVAEQGNISVFTNIWAMLFQRQQQTMPADWARYKKAAGPIRAEDWFGRDTTRPDIVLAFEGGKGTAHELEASGRHGVRAKRIGGWLDPNMQVDRGGKVDSRLPRSNPETFTASTITDTSVPSVHRHISRQEQMLRERLGEEGMRLTHDDEPVVGSRDKPVAPQLISEFDAERAEMLGKLGEDQIFMNSSDRATWPELTMDDRVALSPDDGSNYQHFRMRPYHSRRAPGFDALLNAGLVDPEQDTPEARALWDELTGFVRDKGYAPVRTGWHFDESTAMAGDYKAILADFVRETDEEHYDDVYDLFGGFRNQNVKDQLRRQQLMYQVLMGHASVSDWSPVGMFVKNAGYLDEGWSLNLIRLMLEYFELPPEVIARAIVRDIEPPGMSPTLRAALTDDETRRSLMSQAGFELPGADAPDMDDAARMRLATANRSKRINQLTEAELLEAERGVLEFVSDIQDTDNRLAEVRGVDGHHAHRDVAAVASGIKADDYKTSISRKDALKRLAETRKAMLGASFAPSDPEVTYRVDAMGEGEHFGGLTLDRNSTDIMRAKRVDTTSDLSSAGFSPFDFFQDAMSSADFEGMDEPHENKVFRDLSEIHNTDTPTLQTNFSEREVSFAPGTQFEHVNKPTGPFLAAHRDLAHPQAFNRVNQLQTVPQSIQQGRQHYANIRKMNQGQLPRNTAHALLPDVPADTGMFPITPGGDAPPIMQFTRAQHKDVQNVGKMRSTQLLRKLGAASLPGRTIPMRGGKYIKALMALLAAGIPIALAHQMLSQQGQGVEASTPSDPRSLTSAMQ